MADILLIDDDELVCAMIKTILGVSGHEVRVANTGFDGLAEARGRAPDLILLDMGLPGRDGYAIAKDLRAMLANKTLPIIAVTAYDSASDYDAAYASGCSGFVAKPIDEDRLRSVVAEQLAKQ